MTELLTTTANTARPHRHPLPPPHAQESIEMDDNDAGVSRRSSRQSLLEPGHGDSHAPRLAGVARHTLGLVLLLAVVFLWTLSNFLGSSIFADNTYAKPFFLTYLNTSMFMLAMIPTLFRSAHQRHRKYGDLYRMIRCSVSRKAYRRLDEGDNTAEPEQEEAEAFLRPNKSPSLLEDVDVEEEKGKYLGIVPTARLALMFCILWFGANYLAMACLQYTTVASTTILTSTSSFWTLLIGAFTGTEKFTWRKLCGVFGSLIGVILISGVDLGADTNTNHDGPAAVVVRSLQSFFSSRAVDTFPDKSPAELALGDALALFSAIFYGVYTIALKKTTVKARPRSLNMPLFFGLVGVCNMVLLFPLFPILHFSGLERFALPPTQRVWTILLVNGVSSLCSDICWAYAMVLTSPLLVTVGLSLTIPLSLVGEMVLQGHYEGWVYWLGAAVVVGSFLFVDHEEREEEQAEFEPRRPDIRVPYSDDGEPNAVVP